MHFSVIILAFATILVKFPESHVEGYMIGSNPYHQAETLDKWGKVRLEWLTDLNRKRVTFNLTVQTTGWVGFGLSSSNKMAGADIVIGGVRGDGSRYFTDRHAINYEIPEIDSRQDWQLISARQDDTHTTLSFYRAFDTCDDEDYPISEDKISLLWAYGETDEIRYHHENRGEFPVYLLAPSYAPQITRNSANDPVSISGYEGENVKVWTIRNSYDLPAQDTSYWCTIHKMPSVSQKQHAIGYDVRVETDAARRHLHHLIVHRCHPPPGVDARRMFEQWVGHRGQRCLMIRAPTGPMPTEYCTDYSHAWGVNGRILWQPPDIGLPMGESRDEYYLIQTHYDNPQLRSGVVVDTVMDIYYTSHLRPNEAGLMTIRQQSPGLPPTLLVPPFSINQESLGMCSSDCTRRFFPPEGITVYSVLLHSHNAGRAMRVHQFRNNRELPWLASDSTFSFYYQQFRTMSKPVKVLPGDQLAMRCMYDSTQANGTIVSGFSSQQEMCATWIYYHKKLPNYMQCTSEANAPHFRESLLGVGNVTWSDSRIEYIVDTPPRLAGLTIKEVSDNHVKWNLARRADLQKFQLRHPHQSRCQVELYARLRNNANANPTSEVTVDEIYGSVSYPDRITPYRAPQQSCPLRRY